LSVLRFVINNCGKTGRRGYRVHGASSKGEVVTLLSQHDLNYYDAAIIVHTHPCDAALGLCRYIHTVHKVPTMFLTEGAGLKGAWQNAHASVSLPPATLVADWVERLRVLCERKRGPKTAAGRVLVRPVHQLDMIEVRP
jgi:hypothetical protein